VFFAVVAKDPTAAKVKTWFDESGLSVGSLDEPRAARLSSAFEALIAFRHTQFIPLIYAGAEACQRADALVAHDESIPQNKKADRVKSVIERLVVMAEVIEKYHFVNSTICDRPANEVERLYADTCVKFREASGLEALRSVFDGLVSELKGKLATGESFVDGFTTLRYDVDAPIMHYVFDRLDNFDWENGKALDPDQRRPTFKLPARNKGKRSWTIEHVFPQNPKDPKAHKETLEVVDNVGNLVLLYYKNNSQLQNLLPGEKVRLLKEKLSSQIENQASIRRFLAQYGDKAPSWNAAAIQERAKRLANECYSTVFKL
jgi:hypothetical protein